jgi:hypothetical protein
MLEILTVLPDPPGTTPGFFLMQTKDVPLTDATQLGDRMPSRDAPGARAGGLIMSWLAKGPASPPGPFITHYAQSGRLVASSSKSRSSARAGQRLEAVLHELNRLLDERAGDGRPAERAFGDVGIQISKHLVEAFLAPPARLAQSLNSLHQRPPVSCLVSRLAAPNSRSAPLPAVLIGRQRFQLESLTIASRMSTAKRSSQAIDRDTHKVV